MYIFENLVWPLCLQNIGVCMFFQKYRQPAVFSLPFNHVQLPKWSAKTHSLRFNVCNFCPLSKTDFLLHIFPAIRHKMPKPWTVWNIFGAVFHCWLAFTHSIVLLVCFHCHREWEEPKKASKYCNFDSVSNLHLTCESRPPQLKLQIE